MKRVLHFVLALALIFAMFPGILATEAYADETYTVTLPLTVTITDSKPIDGAFAEFTLTALTEGAPMPDNADANGKIYLPLTVIGGNSMAVTMTFPEIGVYQYTIQMTGGTYYHESIHGTKYMMDVFNLNDSHDYTNESYNGPNFVQIYTELGGKKMEELVYECPLKTISVHKKWADENHSNRSSKITVQLLLNDELVTAPVLVDGKVQEYTYPELRLSKKSDWQGFWHGLDALVETYSVKEKVVPPGYVASYSHEGDMFRITNSAALLQTGQLNWPIPVLYFAGFLFMAAGILMLRRKEDENA